LVAKALSEKPKSMASPQAGGVPVVAAPLGLDPAANYTAAWKEAITAANQAGRTQAFRAMQDGAEQAAPHDGLGIVGFAGVAAGSCRSRSCPCTRRRAGRRRQRRLREASPRPSPLRRTSPKARR